MVFEIKLKIIINKLFKVKSRRIKILLESLFLLKRVVKYSCSSSENCGLRVGREPPHQSLSENSKSGRDSSKRQVN
jgi:hypothetical protein